MTLIISLYASDSLGRLDHSLLPQQSLMEIFVADTVDIEAFQDSQRNFLDIQEWSGLTISDENVTNIDFYGMFYNGGTLEFACIPNTVVTILIGESMLTGEVPWKKMHNEIRCLRLVENQFCGSIDLTAVPRNLIVLWLHMNKFAGTLDFSDLPKNLVSLDLGMNKLSGTVDLRSIQRNITDISEEHQDLFELPMVDKPPVGISFGIILMENQFEGEILVNDIDKVEDEGQFDRNAYTNFRDVAGKSKPIVNQ
mmetsp:Transcript_6909/g.10462  ORF Transcript_6909/g.10462 Transcript_6909/m.10462 type:complete len:253 (-) Transcript_6909:47-805(-)